MSSLVFGRSADQFWLGLYNENSTGTFRWITGEELTYTNWNRDQPGTETHERVYGMTMCAPEEFVSVYHSFYHLVLMQKNAEDEPAFCLVVLQHR